MRQFCTLKHLWWTGEIRGAVDCMLTRWKDASEFHELVAETHPIQFQLTRKYQEVLLVRRAALVCTISKAQGLEHIGSQPAS